MENDHAYKYQVLTFGCQMNKSDSERLETVLQKMGLVRAENREDADVIIMNSCSVRDAAEQRIIGLMREFSNLRAKKPDLIVAVTGCMPGRDRDSKLRQRVKDVDLFFQTKDMVNLPILLSGLNPDLRADLDLGDDYLKLRPAYGRKYQAFLPVQTGCAEYCSYCVVPAARGGVRNRPLRDVLIEASELSASGCKELTLLGQIVNSFIAPDPEHFSCNNPYQDNFAKLLWEINKISGIERVNWTAPHPAYMSSEVIDALTLPKQINYLHLPVQSGNNEVLNRMNRKYTKEQTLDLVKKIRAKRPGMAIGTDIIVGFCGETDEEFADTLDLYKKCGFDISYHAQYSERSGTLAAKRLKDDVPRAVKKARWQKMQDLMEKLTYEKNQIFVGEKVSVLVDKHVDGWCEGNSSEMKRVRYKGPESDIGTIQNVNVFKADTWMMWGRSPAD